MTQQTPFQQLGQQGVRQLVDAFYDAMVTLPEAADIRAMHADDLGPMRSMLAAYLTTWMGGPPVYMAIKGDMCLTDVHAAYAIGPAERDQWLLCMDHALEVTAAPAELKAMLEQPFRQVAETVQNQTLAAPPDPRIIAKG